MQNLYPNTSMKKEYWLLSDVISAKELDLTGILYVQSVRGGDTTAVIDGDEK